MYTVPLALVLNKAINPAQHVQGAEAETEYSWVILGRRVHVAGVGTSNLVAKFCQGPSLSRYNESPCPGIRVKTVTVNEATWDHAFT